MIKILISVYIAAVLLVAGFAEANQLPVTEASTSFDIKTNFQRVRNASKVWVNVGDAKFDSRREVLTLSGNIARECLNTLQPEFSFDEKANSVLVSVTASGQDCLSDLRNHYEILVDIKAFFAEHTLNKDTMVNFIVDNYVGGNGFTFKYLAKQQLQYDFNTTAAGTIAIDHRTGKFYLIGRGSKIEILSRFDLHNFVDRFVQLKGLVPNTFAIGDTASPKTSKLIIGQLTALR